MTNFEKDEYIKIHTITDQEEIRIAKSFPKLKVSFPFKRLVPVAIARFKGDKLIAAWSVNDKFTTGKEYPIYYDFEIDGDYAIGSNGVGYKVVPIAWEYIIEFF